MMFSLNDWFNELCTQHHIDPIKDILVPNITVDKIVALIAILFAIRTFISNNKIAKLNFECQLAASHRDIWSRIFQNESLHNISDPLANPTEITKEQRRYIIFIIINTRLAYLAGKSKIQEFSKQAQKDTGAFFNLPLPNHVWQNVKEFYEEDFNQFIHKAKDRAAGVTSPKRNIATVTKLLFDKVIKLPMRLIDIIKVKSIRYQINSDLLSQLQQIDGDLHEHLNHAVQDYISKKNRKKH
ncbi:hypothetical protein KXQ82_05735 [Mucilaginibacter sp. HMF5004]|uniref:hypothetical protein n=1 Tax=Mucilaginibacter rivuli TaxID=2857527 RepID=UPI001C6037A0|nr:hypothetical protein [Mucilaginibacter rivuli]MBW4889204.1 hypothetical protein [Mucilaginibacter rivuli]